MAGYNTNLASEFYVLAALHRLGAEATLTLGNRKAIDIVIVQGAGRAITIDVKGVAGKWDWPADNIRRPANAARHFIVLVSFEGRFGIPDERPSVWVVPYAKIGGFTKQYRGRRNISRARIKDRGSAYRDAWTLLRP